MGNQNVLRHAEVINLSAGRTGIPAHILAGLIEQESGGNQWAIRFEPHYRWLWGDDRHECLKKPATESEATEWWGQRVSWGLGQVMGAVAREHGFTGWFPELCSPAAGLAYAARHLAWCIRRAGGDLIPGLLRYNGGGRAEYAEQVLSKAQQYKEFLQ